MSTRCNIHFCDGAAIESNVFVHSDGYPEGEHGIPARLKRFFADSAKQNKTDSIYGARFEDPSMLAARFVVWQANEYTKDKAKPLTFGSVRVMTEDAGDAAYIYTVDSGAPDSKGYPSVTYVEASHEDAPAKNKQDRLNDLLDQIKELMAE